MTFTPTGVSLCVSLRRAVVQFLISKEDVWNKYKLNCEQMGLLWSQIEKWVNDAAVNDTALRSWGGSQTRNTQVDRLKRTCSHCEFTIDSQHVCRWDEVIVWGLSAEKKRYNGKFQTIFIFNVSLCSSKKGTLVAIYLYIFSVYRK